MTEKTIEEIVKRRFLPSINYHHISAAEVVYIVIKELKEACFEKSRVEEAIRKVECFANEEREVRHTTKTIWLIALKELRKELGLEG